VIENTTEKIIWFLVALCSCTVFIAQSYTGLIIYKKPCNQIKLSYSVIDNTFLIIKKWRCNILIPKNMLRGYCFGGGFWLSFTDR